jgi:hypothetical protein
MANSSLSLFLLSLLSAPHRRLLSLFTTNFTNQRLPIGIIVNYASKLEDLLEIEIE